MEVKLLKNHQGFKSGEIAEVSEERGSYWIGMGLAEKAGSFKESLKNRATKIFKGKQNNK